MNDLRLAFRQLLKSPGFTTIAILSLALGIGANTAVFSALNAVLLRTLPVRAPNELRLVNWSGIKPRFRGYSGPGTTDAPGGFTVGTSFSYLAYRQLRDRGSGFTELFAFSTPRTVVAVGQGDPASASAMLVSGNAFAGYGADAWIGRLINPSDDQPGAAPVAVVTYRWWEQHCNSDPEALGRQLIINKVAFTVVGVLPRGFMSPVAGDAAEMYVPLSSTSALWPEIQLNSDRWWLQLMGRLASGVDERQAQSALSVVFRQALADAPNTTMGQGGIVVEDGSRGQLILRRELAKPFIALGAAVGIVLLIACANLAGLLLARGAARRHEMAVRAAIGASRWRLIRQSLAESVLLAAAGAGLGLLLAHWSKPLFVGLLSGHSPAGARFDFSLDVRILAFTGLAAALTTILFGLLPALRAARTDPAGALTTRTALGAPRMTVGKILVTAQVALSVLLVVGAGLLIRTFANVARISPGFDPDNVLLFRVRPADLGYGQQQRLDVLERIRTSLAALPGVQSAGYASAALVSDASASDIYEIPGSAAAIGDKVVTQYLEISDDFLRTLRIPLLLGRDFAATDSSNSAPVAVVNESFVRLHFPGQNPIGRSIISQRPTRRALTIVGVARDAKYNRMRAEIAPVVYFSLRQNTAGSVTFALRTAQSPTALVGDVRKTVAAIDAQLPLSLIRTQQDVVRRSVASDRLLAILGGSLGGLAVLLSCIGLYGLMAYDVARRTQEIGVRMALGATPKNIAAPILRECLKLAGAGLFIGIPTALVLARLIRSQLYGIDSYDPVTLGLGTVTLIAIALISAWIPARRAARVDPLVALRSE